MFVKGTRSKSCFFVHGGLWQITIVVKNNRPHFHILYFYLFTKDGCLFLIKHEQYEPLVQEHAQWIGTSRHACFWYRSRNVNTQFKKWSTGPSCIRSPSCHSTFHIKIFSNESFCHSVVEGLTARCVIGIWEPTDLAMEILRRTKIKGKQGQKSTIFYLLRRSNNLIFLERFFIFKFHFVFFRSQVFSPP